MLFTVLPGNMSVRRKNMSVGQEIFSCFLKKSYLCIPLMNNHGKERPIILANMEP